MFKSIRWKFILVYFLLVFVAMVIVGTFIVGKFETQQLDYREDSMTKQIESIISTSTYLGKEDWEDYEEKIQDTIMDWRLDVSETVYIISGENPPKIIASSSREYENIIGRNAYVHKNINPNLIMESYNKKKASYDEKNLNEDTILKHIAYPVVDNLGRVKGLVYMTSNLDDIYNTLNSTKIILTNATLLALFITIILGFFIANSITGPIRDVTEKAEKMAKGDFDQFVEVKSDDEIGQLANMFNYLTLKLKGSIQEIRLEKSKLDTIFNYMADGVLAVDKNNRLIHVNPVAMKILKIEEEHTDLTLRDDIFKDILNMEKIDYEDDENLASEERIYIDSNIYRIRYAPYKDENNISVGVIIVFQDITEQEKLDNMRREFVANVSHELKTPITTIKSYTETLMDYEDLDRPTSNKFLSVIDKECDRMNRIVMDLLQLSNMDYKKVVWEKERFSLVELIEDTVLKLDLSLKEKNQSLDLLLDQDLDQIYFDKDYLQQVLINIIFNSIKYTDEYGEIKIWTEKEGDYLSIVREDNGIGIPEEAKGRVFERFYRVDKSRGRDSGGTGLGLPIAKEIIEGQGGTMSLESEYQVGTQVKIKLPLA